MGMNDYVVLYIPRERPTRNAKNGQFLPGVAPHNKGKKWDEYMPEKSKRRSSKGWKNLDKRPKFRPDNFERCRIAVVAIDGNGNFRPFPSISIAADVTGARSELISRCCKLNKMHRVNKRNGNVNTNYEHNGLRWYYDDDPTWIEKISNNG